MKIFDEDEELMTDLDDFRLFSSPDVRLIGATSLIYDEIEDIGKERGWDMKSDGEDCVDVTPEIGGRLCYLSFNKRRPAETGKTQNQTYLDHIKEVRHTSVLEHSSFNFLLMDVSRNMTHELVRHRVGVAYSQLSSRYVDQFDNKYFLTSKTLGAYIPPEIRDDPELRDAWMDAWVAVQKSYILTFNKLRGLSVKQARSIARSILPGSAGTMIMVTVNGTMLNHMFAKRGAPDADDEIRRVVIGMFKLVSDHNLFNNWRIEVKDEVEFLVAN